MKLTLTLRTVLFAACFVSFISITSAQHNYTMTYGVAVAPQPQSTENDTVTAIDPVTHKKETKVITATLYNTFSSRQSLFENEKDAAPFRDSLRTGLESGVIKGYYDVDDKNPLSPADIKKRFSIIDTVTTINPVTLKEDVKIVKGIGRIDFIRFYEDWSTDKAGNITKRVKAYTLLMKTFDAAGDYMGETNLVTIKNGI